MTSVLPSNLEIFNDPIKGRGIRSKVKFTQGDLIIQEDPYVFCIYKDMVNSFCAFCMKGIDEVFYKNENDSKLISCKYCSKINYCSKECQIKDINIHKIECKWILKVQGVPTVSARIIGRMCIKEYNSNLSWNSKFLYYGNTDILSKEENEEIANLLLECRNYISSEYIPSWQHIYNIANALNINGLTMCSYQPDGIGVGIYTNSSLINHSCKPNCCRAIGGGAQLRVYAQETVEIGDELTFTYIDIAYPVCERYASLTPYQMTCKCRRCYPKDNEFERVLTKLIDSSCSLEKSLEIFKEISPELDKLHTSKNTNKNLNRIFSIEKKLINQVDKSNFLWASLFKEISVYVRNNGMNSNLSKFVLPILEMNKKIYGKFSINYFYDLSLFCVLQHRGNSLGISKIYFQDLLLVSTAAFGKNDPLVILLTSQLSSYL